ncbi:MAG: tetratricopeptide repeat protein [Chthoniobacterales bacterium]
MQQRNFFAELKRRNVYKVAVAYAVVAWLLIQIATATFPVLEIPNWATKLVIAVVAIAFPIALVLAWAFELTPQGIVRTDETVQTPGKHGRHVWIYVVLIAAALSIGLFFLGRYTASTRTAGSEARDKSIAVLPFVDLSQSRDQEYFCDGISEEILNTLAEVGALRVVARTSSFAFKGKAADVAEIARKLGVENVLEGSLQREGNRIRISAQLIDARNGFHLWSETYERELKDMFAMQDEITASIVKALEIKLAVALPVQKKPNPEAYELDLKGRYFLNHRDMKRAIDYFQQALAKDPTDAVAYAGLSEVYVVLAVRGGLAPREVMPKAKEAALQALAIDDARSEAHAALAYVTFFYEWDWPAAEREFKRAIELNPNNADAHHWYSHHLMAQGRIEESLNESKRALELSPFDFLMNIHLTWHYLYARQYDQALDQAQKAAEMDKRAEGAWLGEILEQKGRYAEAIARFQKNLERSSGGSAATKADLAHAYAVSGNRDAAQKIIAELQEQSKSAYVSSFDIALIHAGLGEKDQAFAWFEKAYEERSPDLVTLTTDPRFDNLRSDPRFTHLTRRIGLVPQR